MSTFTINIKTDNAAFRNEDGSLYAFGVRETVLEAMRKLIDQAHTVERGGAVEFFLRDANGNRVGEMTIDEDIPEGEPCAHCGGVIGTSPCEDCNVHTCPACWEAVGCIECAED